MKISSDKVYKKSTTNSLDLVFSGTVVPRNLDKFCVGIEDSNLTQLQPVKAVLTIYGFYLNNVLISEFAYTNNKKTKMNNYKFLERLVMFK